MEAYKADRIVTVNVDVQNDFCPGGSLAVTDGDKVVAPLNELNDFTRRNGGTVVFTGDQHPEQTPHFDTWPVHCVAGTEGAQLRSDLVVQDGDILLDKGTGQTDGYSAFEGLTRDGRELAELITPAEHERVAVFMGGLATDYCVLNSVLDATEVAKNEGDLRIFVIREAIRGVNMEPNDSNEAIERMKRAGAYIVESVADITNERAISLT